MRKALMLGTVLAALVALIPLAVSAQSDEDQGRSYARLSFVQGQVTVDRGTELGTESAEVNLPVAAGNRLVTADGQAEVQFGRSNYLRLGMSSEAEFAALPSRTNDPVKLHLRAGQAYLRVTTLDADKGIEVHTPDASFYILEEGLYRFDVNEGATTEVLVHEGSVEAAGEQGSVVIRTNERLVAANGAIQSGPESFSAAMDGFDRWNETRDGLLDRRSGSSYLPSEISQYENELDDNGRWVQEASYGNVWVPYVQDVDWRPYLYGRWVWYPIIGWTWVSSEPWGWATYHYGRWQWGLGMGWYWIPTRHWGPAWVHWYHGRDHYGWCPLSYHDRPGVVLDGRYHDGWNGRDYPWNSRALTVVHRDRLQSPAISRHALRGSELGALGRISLRADQPGIRPSAGRAGLGSPISRKALSVPGSRATLAERGALSRGNLRAPSTGSLSGSSSRIRTWTSTGRSSATGRLSGPVQGDAAKLRTFPSRRSVESSSAGSGTLSSGRLRSNSVVERPSTRSSKSSGVIRTSPGSSIRSYSGSGKSAPRITTRSYGESGRVREYSSTPTIKSRTADSLRSGSVSRYSPKSYESTREARSSGTLRSPSRSYSYSGPSSSVRSYSPSSSFRSRTSSLPRLSSPSHSYSAPSNSGRSYSGSSFRSSSSFSRQSTPRSHSAPRSSVSSRSSHVSSSRSSSSHSSSRSSHSSSSSKSSSSSGRSGSIRRR